MKRDTGKDVLVCFLSFIVTMGVTAIISDYLNFPQWGYALLIFFTYAAVLVIYFKYF